VSETTPQARTLHRALAICGGLVPLARALGVTVEELSRWLEGHVAPPVNVYLMALDLVAGSPNGGRAKS